MEDWIWISGLLVAVAIFSATHAHAGMPLDTANRATTAAIVPAAPTLQTQGTR